MLERWKFSMSFVFISSNTTPLQKVTSINVIISHEIVVVILGFKFSFYSVSLLAASFLWQRQPIFIWILFVLFTQDNEIMGRIQDACNQLKLNWILNKLGYWFFLSKIWRWWFLTSDLIVLLIMAEKCSETNETCPKLVKFCQRRWWWILLVHSFRRRNRANGFLDSSRTFQNSSKRTNSARS